ncbi:MAG: hypothetical protein ACLFMO_08090 [Eubacteriales bacterium]
MAYKNLFWGFVFLIDIRIGNFDILPDIIAYILLYIGLKILGNKNNYYETAKPIAFCMIFVSLFDLLHVNLGIGLLISLIIIIVNIIFIYNICMGVAEEARKTEDTDIERKALNCWSLYIVYSALNIITFIIPILSILTFVFVVFWHILILMLMNTASYKLDT